MQINVEKNEKSVVIALEGRLDTNTVGQLEEVIDKLKESNELNSLVLDLDSLEYISSAGLRVILRCQKEAENFKVINVSTTIYEIFETTGFNEIVKIEKQLREINIDGLEIIGAGLCGECYKVDDETVLKLYFEEYKDMVDQEKAYAKAAFVLGIPTAISFDMVRCGKRRGLLFEMLNARTFSSVMSEDLDHLDDYAKMYAHFAKQIHEVEGNPKVFRKYNEYYKSLVSQVSYFTEEEKEAMLKLIDTLPDDNTCVHGDFHTSNTMYSDGKLQFIDMGDFSIGNHMYDIAQIYALATKEFSNNLGETSMKLNKENRLRFIKTFLYEYYNLKSDEEMQDKINEIEKYDCVRQMYFIINFAETREENLAYVRKILKKLNLL